MLQTFQPRATGLIVWDQPDFFAKNGMVPSILPHAETRICNLALTENFSRRRAESTASANPAANTGKPASS